MPTPIDILPNFGIKQPHKFILYLATIIFIPSLFVSMDTINIAILQRKLLWIIYLGIITWLTYDIIDDMASKKEYEHKSISELMGYYVGLKTLQFIYLFLSILCLIFIK